MTDVEYSPAVCQTILNEIISLLSLFEENMSISSRLDDILSQHLSGPAVMVERVFLSPFMISIQYVSFPELIGDAG
jgi:hypothetical protein